jgi:uncharacterized phage protein (TIGR01671 family)
MNREILFRGKIINNALKGEWMQGYLFDNDQNDDEAPKQYFVGTLSLEENPNCYGDWVFTATDFYEVEPDTICQYTGFKDKQGNRIFDGDIVRNKDEFSEHIGVVSYSNARFVVDWMIHKHNSNRGISFVTEDLLTSNEVIGNIFDNPELINGGGK